MRDHSPLKYVTIDVNLCDFCHKLDVYSVNFILRMGSWTFVVVEVMLRSHISPKFTLTQLIGKKKDL